MDNHTLFNKYNILPMAPTMIFQFSALAMILSTASYLASGQQSVPSTGAAGIVSSKNAWHEHLQNGQVPRRDRVNIPVDYMNHPFERRLKPSNTNHNRNTQQQSHEPMKVQFDTHLLDALVDNYPTHVSYVRNVLLPSLRNFWAETLSVVPASKIKVPLDGDCAKDVQKTTGHALQDFVQYGSNMRTIANIGDNVMFSNDQSSLVYNNVDLVAIVIPAEGTELCPLGQNADSGQLQTLAFATNCQHDQYDRPVVGYFGVCFGMIDPSDRSTKTHQRRLLTIAHEFTHVLGMTSFDFVYYWDHTTGKPRTPRNSFNKPPYSNVLCVDGTFRSMEIPSQDTLMKTTTINGYVGYEIVTKTVRNVVRNHFNCPSMEGARLENQPTGEGDCYGSHWDHRLFNNEFMSAVYVGADQYVTSLTLALLEDSGWYIPNYMVGQNSPFGLGAGCKFVEEKCVQSGGVPEWALGTFCNNPSDVGCSSDRKRVAFCDISKWNGNLPTGYQYFSDPTLGGGLTQSDFCPAYTTLYKFEVGNENIALDCTDDGINSMWIKEKDETYGLTSRCFESSNGPRGMCMKVQCNNGNLVVLVNGKKHKCTYTGQVLELPGGNDIICPAFEQICPDSSCAANCSGRGVCDYNVSPAKCSCFDRSDNSDICLGSSRQWSFSPTVSPAPTISPEPTGSPTETPAPTESSNALNVYGGWSVWANIAMLSLLQNGLNVNVLDVLL